MSSRATSAATGGDTRASSVAQGSTYPTARRLAWLADPRSTATAGRTIDGTARVADLSRSGTARGMQPGRCYRFDGSTDYLQTDSALSTGANSISACAWIYADTVSGGSDYIASEADSANQIKWGMYRNNADFGVVLSKTGTTEFRKVYVAGSSLSATTWHHVGFTYDHTTDTLTLYVDGAAISSPTQTLDATLDGLHNTTHELQVGATDTTGTPGNFWDGSIFDFRLYSRALTAAEFDRLGNMQCGNRDIGRTDTAGLPIVWFKGDEGGTTTKALNSGSLGSAGDATITAGAIASFHDASDNDQFSFQNEVGFRPVGTFNGTGDYINITSASSQMSIASDHSGSLWFIATSHTANKCLLSATTSSSNRFAVSQVGSNEVTVAAWNGSSYAAKSATYSLNKWHKVTWSYDSSAHTMSGTLDGTDMSGTTSPSTNATAAAYIGALSNGSNVFGGQIALVTIDSGSQWLNDQSATTTITDESGNGNTGLLTATSAAAFWDGSVPRDEANPTKDRLGLTLPYTGQCPHDGVLSSASATFNGTSDKITTAADIGSGISALSVAFWIYVGDITSQATVAAQWLTTGNQRGWSVECNTSEKMQLWLSSDGSGAEGETTATALTQSTWTHVTITYDGTNVRFYLNGVLDTTSATSVATIFDSTNNIIVGAVNSGAAQFFPGRLADFRVYKSTLTAAEAASLYQGTSPDDTVFLHLPLCEGAGAIAHDVSGNQNHGTITGTESAIWANLQNKYDTLTKDGGVVATRYSGTGEYYSHSGRLTTGTNTDLSVAAWVRTTASADQAVCSEFISASDESWWFGMDSTGVAKFQVSDDGTTNETKIASTAINDGDWHHIVVVKDGTSILFYVNGTSEGSGTLTYSALHDNAATFEIARLVNASLWNGMISSIVVEQAAWSSTTVGEIYAGTIPSTAWYWPEGDGLREANQSLASLTKTGTPDRIPLPSGIDIPTTLGPGHLFTGANLAQSVDLAGGQSASPYAVKTAALLADNTYAVGDGDEADVLFVRDQTHGDDRISVFKAALTGDDKTNADNDVGN